MNRSIFQHTSVATVLSLTLCSCVMTPSPDAAPDERGASNPGGSGTVSFSRQLNYQGIGFLIESTGAGSIRQLTITPSGLELDNAPIRREIDDLDADGSPEVYVYVSSAGSGSYGRAVAYAANNRKSLSEIFVPEVGANPAHAVGYMGHDEFAIGEGTLLRRFPIYRPGDSNAAPTGGMRQLQYKLRPGESGWLMVVDRVVDF